MIGDYTLTVGTGTVDNTYYHYNGYPNYTYWPVVTYPYYVLPWYEDKSCTLAHDYRKLDRARLFCTRCGVTKTV